MPKTSKTLQKDTQITHPKKIRFIDLYRQTRGFISDICRAVGIHRRTYYDWLDADKQFALEIAEAEAEINDEMKHALIDKAGSGDMTAIIFWLKNKHDEFKPQKMQGVKFSKDDMTVEFVDYEG